MTRTFVDVGVLIAVIRGDPKLARSALELVESREREFVSSVFLRLEVLPKALYHRHDAEVAVYERYFARVVA